MHSQEIEFQNQNYQPLSNAQKAKKMSIDQIQKKQNRSQSIQNILSSSIARAKQKIQMMEQKKNPKQSRDSINTNRSVQKKQNRDLSNYSKAQNQLNNQQIQTARSKQNNPKSQNSSTAVVNVVKSLQMKISELQKLNESIEREKKIMTKQLNNVSEQKKSLLESLQQVKKRNLHLQQTIIKSTKQQIKQLQQKVETLQSQKIQLNNSIKQLQLKLKQEHQNHLSIQKSNEKKLKQKKQEEKSQQKYQLLYHTKIKQAQQKQRALLIKQKEIIDKENKLQLRLKQLIEKQTELSKRQAQTSKKQSSLQQKQMKNYEQLVRHNETMTLANQIRKQLQDKNNQLRKMLDQDKYRIKQLESKINQQLDKRQSLEVNFDRTYKDKIQLLEEEIQSLKDNHKHNTKSKLMQNNKNQKIDALTSELNDLSFQYQQLLIKLRKTQDKLDKQQKQAKNYRSKFWKLKEIIAEISQKVSKMPNAIHSQLKLLIVKANKLQSYEIQKSSLSNIYGTPSKKNRSISIQNKSTSKLSKQKSKSKMKNTINLTYLDSSRKSNTSAKSKRSQKSERSVSKKKQVILSTTNKAAFNETEIKITHLQKQIQDLKCTYKKLVQIMNEKNDQETRNDLNNLVFELQQKSQELTKLKKQRKKKL